MAIFETFCYNKYMEKTINLPQSFINNMKNLLGDAYDAYHVAVNGPAVHGVRLNTLKADENILKEFNICGKVPYASNGYIIDSGKIGKHPYHIAGLVYVQEPSSMLAVCASELAKEKDKNLCVLDLCASPGGKSGQIAEILAGDGVLVSNEIDSKRAKVLAGNIERMGYNNVIVTNTNPIVLSKNLPHKFDYVFVDAPCGGEGMFRKDPDTILEWKQERLDSNAKRQREILAEAHKMLKPNGKLIYSTCTFAVEEDEQVVEWFLNSYNYKLLMPAESILASTAYYTKKECRRFYPHLASGEGQFVCVMQKANEELVYTHASKVNKLGNSELKMVNEYINNTFDLPFAVNYTKVGENICIINENLQNMLTCMQKIPQINAGVTVGNIEKNRFIPHHNMFTAYGKYSKQKINFDIKNEQLCKYLHGEQLENTYSLNNGYATICVDNNPVGAVRVSGNALKNMFPKGLRI